MAMSYQDFIHVSISITEELGEEIECKVENLKSDCYGS